MRPRRSRRGSVLSDLNSTQGSGLVRIPFLGSPQTGVGTVSAPNIQPGSVGTVHIQPQAVTGPILAPGAFDITHFASGLRPIQIVNSLPAMPDTNYPEGAHVFLTTDDKLYRSTGAGWTAAVPAVDITGTIVEAQIANDAVTSAKIAANAVTVTEIADDAVTSPKIIAGAVLAGKIASGAVETDKLAANAVTAAKIAALTITAAEIASNAITASKILADAVTAGKIAAAAVSAREIAAGAVTTEKLTVGVLQDSAILNGSFEEVAAADATRPAKWTYNSVWGTGSTALSTADRLSGDRSLLLNPGSGVASYNPVAENVPVVPGEIWYISCWAKGTGTGVSSFYLRVRGGATANANNAEITFAVENVDVPAVWTKYEAQATIPAGMFWAGPMILNYSLNTGKGVYVEDVTFQKAVGTANILNAAITNAKIGNVDAGKVTSGILSGVEIRGGAAFTDTMGTFYPVVIQPGGDIVFNSSANHPSSLRFNATDGNYIDQLFFSFSIGSLAIIPDSTVDSSMSITLGNKHNPTNGFDWTASDGMGASWLAYFSPGVYDYVWYSPGAFFGQSISLLSGGTGWEASTGAVRLAIGAKVKSRNATDTGDISLIGLVTGNVIHIDSDGWGTAIGFNPATTGMVRIPNSARIVARSADNLSNHTLLYLGSTNNINLGEDDRPIYLRSSDDNVNFDYPTKPLGGGAVPTFGTIGGTGPATAAQNSWLKIQINGTYSWIPIWR